MCLSSPVLSCRIFGNPKSLPVVETHKWLREREWSIATELAVLAVVVLWKSDVQKSARLPAEPWAGPGPAPSPATHAEPREPLSDSSKEKSSSIWSSPWALQLHTGTHGVFSRLCCLLFGDRCSSCSLLHRQRFFCKDAPRSSQGLPSFRCAFEYCWAADLNVKAWQEMGFVLMEM